MNNETVNQRRSNFWLDTLGNVFLACVFFGLGLWVGRSETIFPYLSGTPRTTPAEAQDAFVPFWEVWTLINERYYEQPVDPDLLAQGAIRGMIEALGDDYSIYLSPEEQEMASASFEGEFEGIGAEVMDDNGAVVIVSPYEGAPAFEAGLRPRDIIRGVDDTDIGGMDLSTVVRMVRGPAGTDVKLTIERDGALFDVIVTRGVIDLPSVAGEILDEDEEKIAYLRLRRFDLQSDDEIEAKLEELMAENPDGLILDLRSNPGGSLTAVVNIIDQFLPEGVALIEKFGNGREEIFETTDEGLAEDTPLVVLVDEGSASASEVFAGAVQDYDRGVIIGETTFGKGTVQTWDSLSDGSGIRLTIARWLTPEGTWVHETGVSPDIEVVIESDDPFRPDEDAVDLQLQAAIDYLQNGSE